LEQNNTWFYGPTFVGQQIQIWFAHPRMFWGKTRSCFLLPKRLGTKQNLILIANVWEGRKSGFGFAQSGGRSWDKNHLLFLMS